MLIIEGFKPFICDDIVNVHILGDCIEGFNVGIFSTLEDAEQVLMSKEMKNDSDKLTIQIKGKGKIGGV